jgi:ABC-type sugar transport system ATPase subunit
LDFKLRERLFDDLRQMREQLGATFIYTTSDPLETLILAEDIHVLDGGKIIESGETEALYAHPQHVRTMELLGFPNTNVFPATLEGGAHVISQALHFGVSTANGAGQASDVRVAVRPQKIHINPASSDGLLVVPADITLVEDLGGELHVYLEVEKTPLEALIPNAGSESLTEGRATIGIHPVDLKVYSAATGQYIGQGTA